MPEDKKKQDEYPKVSGNDKRWKEQDEFDSAGIQRQKEDEDKNQSIADAAQRKQSDEEKGRG